MRKWIEIVEGAKDGDGPEWFRYMWGSFLFHIDQARTMIASGEVKAQRHTIPVKNAYALLGLEQSEYGSKAFIEADPFKSFNMMSGITDRANMPNIPEDKMAEPALIVMWDTVDAMKRIGLPLDKKGQSENSKPSPVLIDGNHRLGRLFLEGAESADVFVIPYEESLKFCYDKYKRPMTKLLKEEVVAFHGTDKVFDKFKVAQGDIGIHFGTEDQAAQRLKNTNRQGQIISYRVNIKNPLRIKDMGEWDDYDRLGDVLIKMGIMTDEEFYRGCKPATPRGLAKFLKSKGYDGLVYKNFAETTSPEIERLQKEYESRKGPYSGKRELWSEICALRNELGQDSYIAFDPSQITVVKS